MHRTARLALALVVASSLLACETTSTNVKPNGQPLKVDIARNAERFAKYDRVFEPGEYEWLAGLYQGGQKLDDELDFYAAAGDQERVDDIIAWRKQANLGYAASWGTFGVGAALLGVTLGYAFGTGKLDDNADPSYLTSTEGQVVLGAMTAGGIIMGGSYVAYQFLGPDRTRHIETPPEGSWTYDLLDSREDAVEAAERYNATLGGGASSSSEAGSGEPGPAAP